MSQTPTIVLVEDDENDALFAKLALERTGCAHELVTLTDGERALDYLLGGGTKTPAFILLDLNLPRLDGRGVMRRLRAAPEAASVPIIVLSSSRLERDVSESYALGANSFVRKPLDFAEFNRGLAVLVTYWLDVHMRLGRTGNLLRACHPIPPPNTPLNLPELLVVDEHADEAAATARVLERVVGQGRFLLTDGRLPSRGLPGVVLFDPACAAGLGAARELLATPERPVVVAFSRDESCLEGCVPLGVNSVVQKPVDAEEYAEVVQLLAAYWLGLNERPPQGSRGGAAR